MKKETTISTIEWRLIAKKIDGNLTPEEDAEFMAWILADVSHRRYFEKAYLAWSPDSFMPLPDMEEAFAEFVDIVQTPKPKPLNKNRNIVRKREILLPLLKIAAILAFAVLSVLVIDHVFDIQSKFSPEKLSFQAVLGTVGHRQLATLILSDGREILLDTLPDGKYQIAPTVRLKREGRTLSYISVNNQVSNQTNSIVVPRGESYVVRLADGSKITLNADSRFTFPIGFTTQVRQTYLDGEAFFNVVKSAVPFEVKTDKADVKVYGTSFNVYAYASEPKFSTSLISGSVGVKRNDKDYDLKPGQEIRINTTTESVKIHNTNTYANCSWLTDILIFENEPVESVAKKIERLYDIQVVFTDTSLKKLHFTGDFDKSKGLENFLGVLSQVLGVNIKQTPKTVILSQK